MTQYMYSEILCGVFFTQ